MRSARGFASPLDRYEPPEPPTRIELHKRKHARAELVKQREHLQLVTLKPRDKPR